MTQTPSLSDTTQPRARHAALIEGTLAAIEALPPLSPDATPQSFPALKAAFRPEVAE